MESNFVSGILKQLRKDENSVEIDQVFLATALKYKLPTATNAQKFLVWEYVGKEVLSALNEKQTKSSEAAVATQIDQMSKQIQSLLNENAMLKNARGNTTVGNTTVVTAVPGQAASSASLYVAPEATLPISEPEPRADDLPSIEQLIAKFERGTKPCALERLAITGKLTQASVNKKISGLGLNATKTASLTALSSELVERLTRRGAPAAELSVLKKRIERLAVEWGLPNKVVADTKDYGLLAKMVACAVVMEQ